MRTVALTTTKGGIQRQRTKGGAREDSLFDFINAYSTQAGSARPRDGTLEDAILPAGTIGLTYFRDKFVVFSDHYIDLSAFPEYQLEILTHPAPDPNTPPHLVDIHFAEPYLGYLYVAAEWSDDPTIAFHYWLQSAGTWQPNHVYQLGEVVTPTTPNGLTYRANRLNGPADKWAPNVPRALGDRVEPTKYNGYDYTVTDTLGSNPRSGANEPVWVKTEGGITIEDADNPTPPSSGTGGGPGTTLPPDVPTRYGNGKNDTLTLEPT